MRTQTVKVKISQRRAQLGLSLVELMVAMGISLFMLTAIALVYMSSKTGFVYANNTVRMSEDASFALETISRDVRMAAYGGCKGTSLLSTGKGADNLANTADDPIDPPTGASTTDPTTSSSPKLFNVTTLGSNPELNLFYSTNGLYTALNAVRGVKEGTDGATDRAKLPTSTSYSISATAPMLHVSGGSAKALQVTPGSLPAIGDTSITLAVDPYKWATKSMLLLLSDCNGSELFRTVAGATGSTTLDLETGKKVLNTYNPDALIAPITASTYFLATRTGASTPSLYRRYFDGNTATSPAEELVPNVEAITFQYGINTANNPTTGEPTYRADIYKKNTGTDESAAGQALSNYDWSRVVSVRIGLIVVSEETGKRVDADTSVDWINGTYTPPNTTDRRLRHAYSTTVSIRNRSGL